ncbi:hypothetical protein FPZ42_12595 [Mucilaginibacter achroorhodeus]|uniref:Uncharacterized protein n=1 Tax=Mucilaginibacter achroorhodeus TaxID=2599294 RepID=A0A563U1J5_9SPHI|nr:MULTISPECIES: hypothetical protein [Mucilaginibacter]QXV63933.1 hypothetical protein INP83_12560 [Mucilaginibacter sp. 21P]TWR25433.1 hypothetical protein FPZ42_12595 [Mucilaginibacter achroorhodeus]
MLKGRYSLVVAALALLAACSSNDKKPVKASAPPKPALMAPFRYHKAIEVSPGQTYDVVSWGRGSTDAGAFAILHSDSAAIKYTTTTGDLDGSITDVFNADMDNDGNPEILIQAKAKDTVSYARIYAFEFNNSGANKLDFPKLTNSQRRGYRGGDNFYIKEGKLIREFPIYSSNDSLAKTTGATRQLEYSLRSNSFSVKQLSKDSTDVVPTAVQQTKKSDQTSKQSVSRSSKKKRSESRRGRRRRN